MGKINFEKSDYRYLESYLGLEKNSLLEIKREIRINEHGHEYIVYVIRPDERQESYVRLDKIRNIFKSWISSLESNEHVSDDNFFCSTVTNSIEIQSFAGTYFGNMLEEIPSENKRLTQQESKLCRDIEKQLNLTENSVISIEKDKRHDVYTIMLNYKIIKNDEAQKICDLIYKRLREISKKVRPENIEICSKVFREINIKSTAAEVFKMHFNAEALELKEPEQIVVNSYENDLHDGFEKQEKVFPTYHFIQEKTEGIQDPLTTSVFEKKLGVVDGAIKEISLNKNSFHIEFFKHAEVNKQTKENLLSLLLTGLSREDQDECLLLASNAIDFRISPGFSHYSPSISINGEPLKYVRRYLASDAFRKDAEIEKAKQNNEMTKSKLINEFDSSLLEKALGMGPESIKKMHFKDGTGMILFTSKVKKEAAKEALEVIIKKYDLKISKKSQIGLIFNWTLSRDEWIRFLQCVAKA